MADIKDECQTEVNKESWLKIEATFARLLLRECDLEKLDEQVLDTATKEFFSGPDYERELVQTDEYGAMISQVKLMVEEIRLTCEDQKEDKSQEDKKKKVGVKLPVLEMPTFDGDVTSYVPFMQTFEEAIGSNGNLSDLDKFKYLKSFLKGEAAKVIKPIPVRSDNYKLVKKTLEDNFGQTETITHAHIKALNELKKVTDAENVPNLRELLNTLEYHVRSIQNIGVNLKEYNLLLFHKVSNTLPKEIVLEYCRKDGPAEVDSLMIWLRKEIASRGRCQLLNQKLETPREKLSKPVRTTATLYSGLETEVDVSAMATGVSESTQRLVNKRREIKPFCVLCYEGEHWTDQCAVERSWQDKRKILSRRGRCFQCASRDHLARDCQNPKCLCTKCGGRHITVLCPENLPERATEERSVASMSVQSTRQWESHMETNLLQTAHALVVYKEKEVDVRVLLDGGSQCSFVTEAMVKRLRLTSVSTVKVKLNTFGGAAAKRKCRVVIVPLRNRERVVVCRVTALVVPTLSVQDLPYASQDTQRLCAEQNLTLADRPIYPGARESSHIDMLVGVDSYWEIVDGPIRRVSESIVAASTRLGWVLQGNQALLVLEPRTDCVSVNFVQTSVLSEEAVDWQHLWRFDTLGVEPTGRAEDEVQLVDITDTQEGYQVTLPWVIERKSRLSNNVTMAQQRLNSLLVKLERQDGMLTTYHEAIRKYLDQGHAVEAAPSRTSQPGYFMPHRAVIRQGTTTDVRIVFDASSKAPGELSLNDCVYAGDDRHLDIIGILLRFRQHQWAMVSDIQQAFLQIRMEPEDQEYLKFLWLDVNAPVERPYKIKEYQMDRVTFGVNASPHLLKLVLHHHLTKFRTVDPELITMCLRNMYVDDNVLSASERQKLVEGQRKLDAIFRAGGFALRKWATNDQELMKEWEESHVAVESKRTIKVLGQGWNTTTDTMWVRISADQEGASEIKTKRGILQCVASIFDPLGIMSVLVVKAKRLMQELWSQGYGWDDYIDRELQSQWKKWVVDMVNCNGTEISRWCGYKSEYKGQVHVFCDASQIAFGTVLFIRQESAPGNSWASFQTAKYRIAPVKEASLPYLELMGALLAARTVNYWLKEVSIDIDQIWLWTDSKIVLDWIRRTDRLRKQVVQNRVEEIRRLTRPSQWRHCPGIVNPADKATRVQDMITREVITKWIQGPDWVLDEELWPSIEVGELLEIEPEPVVLQVQVALSEAIQEKRYERWSKLMRVTGWCWRFINNCRSKKPERTHAQHLLISELHNAWKWWIKVIQRKWFSKDIKALDQGLGPPRTSELRRLSVTLDSDGVLRLRTRLESSMLVPEVTSPVILPGHDMVVRKWLMYRHVVLLHVGVSGLMCDARSKFWITKCRRACKHVIGECLMCIRQDGPRFQPRTGLLPIERVEPGMAFTNVGLDFAGPIHVRGDGSKKVYLLLVTCFYSRAVHLEVVSNLTTEMFMLALQRYLARRGQPSVIHSDNALTFKKAAKILKQVLNHTVNFPKHSFFKLDSLTWTFIPERAPWMGGVWERMIKSVKGFLRKILGSAELTYEELSTVMCVIESVINSRPLTYMSDDPTEAGALTPNHLVTGRPLGALPMYQLSVVSQLDFMSRYKYVNSLLQHFNRRWLKEYLLQLKQNHVVNTGSRFLPSVGDVVLVESDDLKKHLYPIAKVVSLSIGRDGIARSAMLLFPDHKKLCRPIKRLFPLEPSVILGGSVRNGPPSM